MCPQKRKCAASLGKVGWRWEAASLAQRFPGVSFLQIEEVTPQIRERLPKAPPRRAGGQVVLENATHIVWGQNKERVVAAAAFVAAAIAAADSSMNEDTAA